MVVGRQEKGHVLDSAKAHRMEGFRRTGAGRVGEVEAVRPV